MKAIRIIAGCTMGLMAFALTLSTWAYLMGFAPHPQDGILEGRFLMGMLLGTGAGMILFLPDIGP